MKMGKYVGIPVCLLFHGGLAEIGWGKYCVAMTVSAFCRLF